MVILTMMNLKNLSDYCRAFYYALEETFRPTYLLSLNTIDVEKFDKKKTKKSLVKFVTKFCTEQMSEFVWTRQRWERKLESVNFEPDETLNSFLDKLLYVVNKAFPNFNSVTAIQKTIKIIWAKLPRKFKKRLHHSPDMYFFVGDNPSTDFEEFIRKLRKHYRVYSEINQMHDREYDEGMVRDVRNESDDQDSSDESEDSSEYSDSSESDDNKV